MKFRSRFTAVTMVAILGVLGVACGDDDDADTDIDVTETDGDTGTDTGTDAPTAPMTTESPAS